MKKWLAFVSLAALAACSLPRLESGMAFSSYLPADPKAFAARYGATITAIVDTEYRSPARFVVEGDGFHGAYQDSGMYSIAVEKPSALLVEGLDFIGMDRSRIEQVFGKAAKVSDEELAWISHTFNSE